MFDQLIDLYQVDWDVYMYAVRSWLEGRGAYVPFESGEFSYFAYPPTALPWLALFLPLGFLGFYVWTGLQLALWWRIIKDEHRQQLLLLAWSPLLLHLIEGQSTFMTMLIMWAAFKAPARGWRWGFALALAMTKPQAALIPLLWLLWQDRRSPTRWRLWGGIAVGTLLLALPATVMNPLIWRDWLASTQLYRERQLFVAVWQSPSVLLFGLAAYLWHRSGRQGWHWWLNVAVWPQTAVYVMVGMMPAIIPSGGTRNYWPLAGLGLASVLLAPVTQTILPWLLAGHFLAAWMIAGGPRAPDQAPAPAAAPPETPAPA